MSRIGKIARLPSAVREELNERLVEGEPQGQLVAWLNGRDDVQAVLKAHFDGRPISDQNLSLWVQGGYEDWKHQQAAVDVASRFVEDTSAVAEVMTKQTGTDVRADGLLSSLVSDRVAMMAALSIGELLMATRRMEDGAEKRRAILKIIRGLVRLRKSERECERGQREAAQAERSAEMHEMWAERARRSRRTEDGGRRTEDRERRTEAGEPGAGTSMSEDERWDREDGPPAVAASTGYKPMVLDEETKRRLAPNGVPGDWVFLTGPEDRGPSFAKPTAGGRAEGGGRRGDSK